MTTKTLSRVVKKYYAKLKDGRNISIDDFDKWQIEALKSWSNFSAFIQIGSWRDKFNGEISMIQEVVEVKTQVIAWMRYICDFGTRHPIVERCSCETEFQIYPWNFRAEAIKIFDKYPSELSQSQIDEIINCAPKIKSNL